MGDGICIIILLVLTLMYGVLLHMLSNRTSDTFLGSQARLRAYRRDAEIFPPDADSNKRIDGEPPVPKMIVSTADYSKANGTSGIGTTTSTKADVTTEQSSTPTAALTTSSSSSSTSISSMTVRNEGSTIIDWSSTRGAEGEGGQASTATLPLNGTSPTPGHSKLASSSESPSPADSTRDLADTTTLQASTSSSVRTTRTVSTTTTTNQRAGVIYVDGKKYTIYDGVGYFGPFPYVQTLDINTSYNCFLIVCLPSGIEKSYPRNADGYTVPINGGLMSLAGRCN